MSKKVNKNEDFFHFQPFNRRGYYRITDYT